MIDRTRWHAGFAIAFALVCGTLTSACTDRPLAPSEGGFDPVRTNVVWTISRQLSTDARAIEVQVGYNRAAGEFVKLADDSFPVALSSLQLPLTVDLSPCLSDRARGAPSDTCALIAIVSLKDAAGTTIATATAGPTNATRGSAIAVLTVAVDAVRTVSVTPFAPSILVGSTTQLSATATDSAGTVLPGRIVAWTSTNPSVATVSATGLLTATGRGVDTVKATSEDRVGVAVVTTTVRHEFCPGDPTAESDFQTAINDAPAGSTLLICNGQFTVAGTLGKALTVRAESPGQATLAQDPAATGTAAILTVAGVASGTVSITGINFAYSNIGLRTLDFDSLSVTQTTFIGPAAATLAVTPQAARGVVLDLTVTPPTSAFFDHDTFVGGVVGLSQGQPINIVTTNSTFHDQENFGLILSTATGDQNPVPAGGTALTRSGRAEFNTFTNCGLTSGACIALEESGADTVRHNTIRMPAGIVSDGIFINRSGMTAALTHPAIITDNVLSGHALVGDSTVGANWGFIGGIVENEGVAGVVDVIQRNQITTAFTGLQLRGFAATGQFVNVDAQDNAITHTYVGIAIALAGDVLTAHRNDIIDYVIPIGNGASVAAGAPVVGTGSLTCNWWGSASGPITVFAGVLVSAYTPYATTPIANTSVVCP